LPVKVALPGPCSRNVHVGAGVVGVEDLDERSPFAIEPVSQRPVELSVDRPLADGLRSQCSRSNFGGQRKCTFGACLGCNDLVGETDPIVASEGEFATATEGVSAHRADHEPGNGGHRIERVVECGADRGRLVGSTEL